MEEMQKKFKIGPREFKRFAVGLTLDAIKT